MGERTFEVGTYFIFCPSCGCWWSGYEVFTELPCGHDSGSDEKPLEVTEVDQRRGIVTIK